MCSSRGGTLTISRNARLRGGTSTKTPGQNKSPVSTSSGHPQSPTNLSQGSQSSSSLVAPKIPPLPSSPSLAQNIGMDDPAAFASNGNDILSSYHLPRPLPLWLNAQYAKHIVKGNFMTLSARPKTVEQGEWIAHQGTWHLPRSLGFVKTY